MSESSSQLPDSLAGLLPGLQELWAHTTGDPRITIAVLDGPVDASHAAFEGAALESPELSGQGPPTPGRMTAHGTHVASLIFGQPGGAAPGVAPSCRGVSIPVFFDTQHGSTPQSQLAAAIDQAVDYGAHVINISGGELTAGEIDPSLLRSLQGCHARNVLVVAAAGNDGCECLHVPAAHSTVLAVGASDGQGQPLESSNWGATYRLNGVLAPGQNLVGAVPSGGVTSRSGTSFATPLVSGIAGLLLSAQVARGERADPASVRSAILASATPCNGVKVADCRRVLAGHLNIPGAFQLIQQGDTAMSDVTPLDTQPLVGLEPGSEPVAQKAAIASEGDRDRNTPNLPCSAANSTVSAVPSAEVLSSRGDMRGGSGGRRSRGHAGVTASCGCQAADSDAGGLVYAIGVLGYDFGTEARRDGFKQLMPDVHYTENGSYPCPANEKKHPPFFPANPYDQQQMVHYLAGYPYPKPPYPVRGGLPSVNPPSYPAAGEDGGPPAPPSSYPKEGFPGTMSDTAELIWTLSIELTPIYAIRPSRQFATEIYQRLVETLAGQILPEDHPESVSRLSVPGILTGETVQLYSGQVIPVIEPKLRGMYSWRTEALTDKALEAVRIQSQVRARGASEKQREQDTQMVEDAAKKNLAQFLDRIYYDLRNRGRLPAERALNFAATNAFQAAAIFEDADKVQLDCISVEQSPFCRMDSDCWDVKLRFFNPLNDHEARQVYRYTIDVSDAFPVQVGDVRLWSESPFGCR